MREGFRGEEGPDSRYVNHQHKLIWTYTVTPAATHDRHPDNSSGEVWADSAYQSEAIVEELTGAGDRPHIQRKGRRGRALSGPEQKGNRTRSRVEHVFGIQSTMAGDLTVRTIGLARAKIKIGLRNLSYNMNRLKSLLKRPLAAG